MRKHPQPFSSPGRHRPFLIRPGRLLAAVLALLFLAVDASLGMDAPHDTDCLDCHKTHAVFGDAFSSPVGNANVCQSCHQPGGQAHRLVLSETDQALPGPGLPADLLPGGTSHRWDASPAGHVMATGPTPTDALVPTGVYTGRYAQTYAIRITAAGDAGSARFAWTANGPLGGSGTNLLTGSGVLLENGVQLSFRNCRSNGPAFLAGDSWQLLVRPGLTLPANQEMLSLLPDGVVVCSTCHNQHEQFAEPFDAAAPAYIVGANNTGRHFLRADNDQDQMCRECHGSRFVTEAGLGSHPVGVFVPTNTAYHPPRSLPLDKVNGRMWCSTCHQVHNSPGRDGALLRTDGRGLCLECHFQADTASPASHLNPMTAPLWPGGQYGSRFPALTDPQQRGGCANCHRIHGWPDAASATNDYPMLLVEGEEKLCYTCHDGSPATKDIRGQFSKTYTHPVSLTGLHAPDEDGIPARYGMGNRHAECADCHNVHQLGADYQPVAAPQASANLKGVPRVSVNNISSSQVTYTYRSGADPTPAKEYEICFVCHSSWTTQPAGQTNYAAVLNTKNPSFHPVEAVAMDTGINPGSFTNGWGPGMLVTCTDCHASDDANIRGPHGSANQWILKKPYVRANSPALPANGICFECHSAGVYNTSGSGLSRFRGVDRPGHTHGGFNCYACHVSHGSSSKPFLLGNSLSTYTKTATGGTCNPTCHGSESYTVAYPR